MGKSDDLARLRAEQHARLERETKRSADEAKRAPAPPPPAPVAVVLAPPAVAAPAVEVVTAPSEVVVAPPIALVPVPLDGAVAAPVNEQRAVEKKGKAAKASAAPSAKKAEPNKSKTKADATASGDETGRCSSCGKVKALNRGLVVDHQKGLGKSCPGSRKAPA